MRTCPIIPQMVPASPDSVGSRTSPSKDVVDHTPVFSVPIKYVYTKFLAIAFIVAILGDGVQFLATSSHNSSTTDGDSAHGGAIASSSSTFVSSDPYIVWESNNIQSESSNQAIESKPSLTKVVVEKPGRPQSVLYFVSLDLPEEFLGMVGNLNYLFWRDLHATKIGQAEDWEHFLDKIQHLQTHISFARLKYTAIIHHHDPYDAEQAIHFVVRRFHIAGEWYDISIPTKNYLVRKFPGCEIRNGYSHLPAILGVTQPEGPGCVYLAQYNWNEAELAVIDTILNLFPQFALIASRMLNTKIGSTIDLSDRLSEYTWAVCFADIRYVAFLHFFIRTEEQRLHNTRAHLWSGVGEWFILNNQEHQAIEQEYQLWPRDDGIKVRNRGRVTIFRFDLYRWRFVLGLVTMIDVAWNIICGLIPPAFFN